MFQTVINGVPTVLDVVLVDSGEEPENASSDAVFGGLLWYGNFWYGPQHAAAAQEIVDAC